MASRCALLFLVLCSLSLAEAKLKVFDLRATDLPSDFLGTTDGYVKVFSGGASLGKTYVRKNNPNPWWDEEFSSFNSQENEVLRLEVYDRDLIFDDLLGVCQRQIKLGTHMHDCFLMKGGILHYTYTLD